MTVRRTFLGAGIRSIARNGMLLTGSTWIETAIRFGYVFAIVRYLGAEAYGIWAYAIAAYGLALGLSMFGLEPLIQIRLGANQQDAGRYLGATLALRLVLVTVAAAGLAGYAALGEPETPIRLALLLAIPALVGRSLALWVRTVFLGFERIGRYVRLAVFIRLAEAAAGIALLAAGAGVLTLIALHALCWIAEAAMGVRMVQRMLTPLVPNLERGQIVELTRKGLTLGLAAILTSWLSAGPLLLFRHANEQDLAAVGQFALALQVGTLMVASVQPFFAAALPVLSRSVARDDPRTGAYGMITAAASLALFLAAAVFGFAAGPGVMTGMFGSDFDLAGRLLGPCILVGALMIVPTGYQQLLVVQGHRWPGVAASALGGLMLIAALPHLTSAWGALGAAIATGAAWLMRALVLLAMAWLGRRST